MGSSSAFTVGLLHALYGLKGHIPSKRQLAKESIHIEQKCLKETVGSQDQVLASHGGFNHITFLSNDDFSIRPMTLTAGRIQELNSHLMLFYTGIKRTASDVAKSYVNDIEGRRRQLRIMRDLVDEGVAILNSDQDMTAFGKLLHEAWQAKRSLSAKVSNSHVDEIYDQAISAGAVGGKLTGAGGGGFLLLFVPPDRQGQVKDKLNRLLYVPVKFEYSGSQIIFFDPEEDYSAEDKARVSQPTQVFRELCDS
jgi:D-glycero-alpha-D-manno-heptose-7-phosphate kinase